jgi:DnaJ-class molecular chaperone
MNVNSCDDRPMPVEAEICTFCNGRGEYSVHSGGPDGYEYVSCDMCDGKGWVVE